MKKFLYITLFAIANLSFGQYDLSFYQMGNATPQHNNYNAAVFPKGKAFFSLPVISGVNTSVSLGFGMNDILTKTGDSTLVDIDKFLAEQTEGTFMNYSFNPTIFMMGFRVGEKGFLTAFANERMDFTMFYPLKMIQFAWNGNAEYVGENYVIDDFKYNFTAYHEYGIGYGHTFNIAGMNTTFGVRAKYLVGWAHAGIEEDVSMNIYTADATSENPYMMEVTLNSGKMVQAGFNQLESLQDDGAAIDYFINNQNTGFGLDFGVDMDVTDRISAGLAINDLGFIDWKDDSESVSFNGTSFTIEGSAFDDLDKLGETVQDSIDNLEIDTAAAEFRTSLNSKVFLSGSYRVTDQGYAMLTVSNFFNQGEMNSALGVGYRQDFGNWFTFSLTGSYSKQFGPDFGAGLMLRGGFFQLYTNVDNIMNTIDIPNAQGFNIKFGINFVFGKHGIPDKIIKNPDDVDITY